MKNCRSDDLDDIETRRGLRQDAIRLLHRIGLTRVPVYDAIDGILPKDFTVELIGRIQDPLVHLGLMYRTRNTRLSQSAFPGVLSLKEVVILLLRYNIIDATRIAVSNAYGGIVLAIVDTVQKRIYEDMDINQKPVTRRIEETETGNNYTISFSDLEDILRENNVHLAGYPSLKAWHKRYEDFYRNYYGTLFALDNVFYEGSIEELIRFLKAQDRVPIIVADTPANSLRTAAAGSKRSNTAWSIIQKIWTPLGLKFVIEDEKVVGSRLDNVRIPDNKFEKLTHSREAAESDIFDIKGGFAHKLWDETEYLTDLSLAAGRSRIYFVQAGTDTPDTNGLSPLNRYRTYGSQMMPIEPYLVATAYTRHEIVGNRICGELTTLYTGDTNTQIYDLADGYPLLIYNPTNGLTVILKTQRVYDTMRPVAVRTMPRVNPVSV